MNNPSILRGIFRTGSVCVLALLGFVGAHAQVESINGVIVTPRVFNDVPGSTLITFNNYPSIIYISDQNVSAPSGFANRHTWAFSADAGATAYKFSNDNFFHAELSLTLTGDPASPRKEAGFLLDSIGGQGQFIVNTDAGEVVAFGGPFPFYKFSQLFASGETVTLGLTYFKDISGKRSIIYSANGVDSPPQEFTNLEQGIIDNSTLGGYVQIQNAPGTPGNSGTATFQNIGITAVPEPSSLALLALVAGPLFWLHRRR